MHLSQILNYLTKEGTIMKYDNVNEFVKGVTDLASQLQLRPSDVMHALLLLYASLCGTMGMSKDKAVNLFEKWADACSEGLFATEDESSSGDMIN